jgi:hypothetical protein
MVADPRAKRFLSPFFLIAAMLFGPALTKAQKVEECSVSKTNQNCTLIIDRSIPVAPPAIQMYSTQSMVVVVKNPLFFERYSLDFQTGQAVIAPDVSSAIVQALLPSLAKLGEFASRSANFVAPAGGCDDAKITSLPDEGGVGDTVTPFQVCVAGLSKTAIGLYKKLEPYVAPDSASPDPVVGSELTLEKLEAIQRAIDDYVSSELVISSRISSIAGARKAPVDALGVTELTALQKVSDAVATDLAAYSQRITDLKDFKNGAVACSALKIDMTPAEKKKAEEDTKNHKTTSPPMCVRLSSRPDDPDVYRNMVTRTITYSLNMFNVVGNSQNGVPDPSKKKPLATVAINFAEERKSARSAFRLEASAGAFFSTLPIRSFSVAPQFTKGVITDKIIGQNVLHPTVVPFAAANYRITDDLPGRWKSNLYLTGAVGINPNTVSADFATGLSYAWRLLMVSGLAHFGHDVSLAQGLTVGESLGAGFNGSLPTKTHWTTAFAFGLSVRIPALVGR